MNRSWYTGNTTQNLPDSVHQTFAFGTLSEIQVLKKKVGEKKLKDLFIVYPKKIYTASAFHFITRFILHISSALDAQKYLKSTSRYTR